jgi:hypothetical protein
MRPILAISVVAAALLNGCASSRMDGEGPAAPLAALETRAQQTRRYDTADRRLVLTAVAQGLQDAGFQLRTSDADLGLITGISEHSEGREASAFLKALFWYPYLIPFRGRLGTRTHVVVEVTATVSPLADQMRVRLACQRRLLDNSGKLKETRVLEEAGFYQELFARIDKALFLEKEKL